MKSKRQLKSEAFLASKRKKPLTPKELKMRSPYGEGYLKAFGHRLIEPTIHC